MKNLNFILSEDNYRAIDEVRATLNIIASMGFSGTDHQCNDLSKNDLITVLCMAEEKLKHVLADTDKS